MQENRFTKQSRLLSISFRLGLSLALGALFVLFLISLVSVASSSLVAAGSSAPGDLDATFGSSGVVTTSVGPDDEYAYDVAIQPDGKIVVVGYADNGSDNDFALTRYTVSGTLDASFGSGGVVTTPIGPRDDYGWSVAIQPDGKIVVVGYASNGSDEDFALARYTVSGTLDTSFGSNGIVITSIGSSYDYAFDVAIQPDGKIVVVGYAYNGSSIYDFALARYTISGTLDASFGSGGVVTTPIDSGDSFGWSVVLQLDGKIVAAGAAYNGSDYTFCLARYTVSGALDTSFGSNGVVTTPVGTDGDWAYDVAIQPDGKIVAAGYAGYGSDTDFALARYTVSGTLDTSFGSGGVVTTPIGSSYDHVYDVAIQSDGKIVAAGYASNGSDDDFALARYTASGTLDTTFGSGGVVITPIGLGDDHGWSVAIQPDGKIVAAGFAYNGSDDDFAVVRYHGGGGGFAIYLPLVLRDS